MRSKITRISRYLTAVLTLLCGLPLAASVVRVEVTGTERLADGLSMGEAGPYKRVTAKVHFAVDPKAPANRMYMISGTQHGPSPFPPPRALWLETDMSSTATCRPLSNARPRNGTSS